MSAVTPSRIRRLRESWVLAGGLVALALTVVHHVYGAIRYATPERYHAVFIAVAALAVILAGFTLHRRQHLSLDGSQAGHLHSYEITRSA